MAKVKYSEAEMGDAFQRRLQSGRPLSGLGRFTRVFREVDCQRGRPDFVGVSLAQRRLVLTGTGVGGLAAAAVLSLLKPESPRRLDYLIRHSGFRREAVTSAIRHLLIQGFIEREGSEAYTLAGACDLFDLDVTAFELKLSSPRRAVFQAQQYSLFAHRSIIVVPPTQIGAFTAYLPSLHRWGIGLASFDPLTHRFQLSIPPQRTNPASRQHQAYALLRLVSGSSA